VQSDCIVIEGSNFAECHPVAFRWAMKAKLKGATIIHVDPRFTRTSALANIHAPVRAGSDIAFLGGLIRYVINSEKWRNDDFFRQYVVNYTNAATIINKDFKDTEDDPAGVFSGLMEYTGDPMNGFTHEYDNKSWQYQGTQAQDQGRTANTAQSGEQGVESGQEGQTPKLPPDAPLSEIPALLRKPPPDNDPTLQDPRCVFQIIRRHFDRYTPEMVERVTGCPRETFTRVAETILENSGRDRTTNFAYAVGWTQHTYGPQMISASALLQLLLGNIGRPGGGVLALRGHATIQGSTDIPTLYHSIHGYMPAPSALKTKKHDTLRDYLMSETLATGYWANMPKFLVSYMKSMYGDAATPENGWGWHWHPKVSGDHSHMPMFLEMAAGKVRGMYSMGQNPAVGGQNARVQRRALAKLEWLVVKDNFVTETAAFWGPNSPEIRNGELKAEDIGTEVFFFPSNQVAEMDGSFTNTQRLVQWHNKAAGAPGDCRSDLWFTYQLGTRLKALYARSDMPRDEGIRNLVWNYDIDEETRTLREAELSKLGGDDAAKHEEEPEGEPDIRKIMREINGYMTGDPATHVRGFADLKDDGSTTCASWIYSGIYPEPGKLLANSRDAKPEETEAGLPSLGWGYAWPANRRVLYNRASADPDGKPWSERKRYIYWDPSSTTDPKTGKPWTNPAGEPVVGAWLGPDSPDFTRNKPPDYEPPEDAVGMDAHSGRDPFILKMDGRGWLVTPTGLVDGPLPTHYEPAESPVVNPLYPERSTSPVIKYWQREDNALAPAGDAAYPHVLTTYRLTEHHLSGVMSRWLPWLSELQPELFAEIGPELAREKGIANLDLVRVSTPRGEIRAKALVTGRMRPLQVAGKTLHHVGLPWHWGYEGVVKGAVVNDLTALVGDPNVSIHEGKAFVCNVEKA
jgi:formate dehydrogenase major subunit